MTLLDLRANNQNLFHANQTWFDDEDFAYAPLPSGLFRAPPAFTVLDGTKPSDHVASRLPLTVTLAHLYVQHPQAEIWSRYLWTGDTDRHGQRVFMGVNDGRMEIHRHLHLTDRFGCPAWP